MAKPFLDCLDLFIPWEGDRIQDQDVADRRKYKNKKRLDLKGNIHRIALLGDKPPGIFDNDEKPVISAQ